MRMMSPHGISKDAEALIRLWQLALRDRRAGFQIQHVDTAAIGLAQLRKDAMRERREASTAYDAFAQHAELGVNCPAISVTRGIGIDSSQSGPVAATSSSTS
jgi:hypothetical protein